MMGILRKPDKLFPPVASPPPVVEARDNRMSLRTPINLNAHVFHSIPYKGLVYRVIVGEYVPQGTLLYLEDYEAARGIETFFEVGQLGLGDYPSKGGQLVGYLLYSNHNIISLGTFVLAHSKQKSAHQQVSMRPVLRTPLFHLMHSPNVASIASSDLLNDKIQAALTQAS